MTGRSREVRAADVARGSVALQKVLRDRLRRRTKWEQVRRRGWPRICRDFDVNVLRSIIVSIRVLREVRDRLKEGA